MRKHRHSTARRRRRLGPLVLVAHVVLFLGLTRSSLSEAMEGITAPPPAAPECKPAGVTISFAGGSTEIDRNGRGELAGVATWLQNGGGRTVRLEGYATGTGNAAANQRLSERRAQAAKDFLLGRGIEPDRVMVFGHGDGEQDGRKLTGADARVVVVTACEVPDETAAAPAPRPPEATPEPDAVAEAADEPAPLTDPVNVAPHMAVGPPRPRSALGVEATVGGGAIGFIDEGARNVTSTGAVWDARLMFGSRLPLAVEGAYVGSVQGIDALGLSTSSLLIGNGVEGTLRFNLTRRRVQPYLFGGIGWTHYQLSNAATNTSSVLARDDIGTVPLGAGISGRLGRGFIVDARGTYRATFDDELLRAQETTNNTMQSWSAAARGGFEF